MNLQQGIEQAMELFRNGSIDFEGLRHALQQLPPEKREPDPRDDDPAYMYVRAELNMSDTTPSVYDLYVAKLVDMEQLLELEEAVSFDPAAATPPEGGADSDRQ